MNNIDLTIYPQDDIGGILNVPAGAEHVPPMRPAAIDAHVRNDSIDTPVATPAPHRASLFMKVIVGGTLVACIGLGVILLLRSV